MKKIYLIKKKLKDEQEKSLFRVSFTVPGSSIYQMNLVRATSTDEAKEKFITHNTNKGRTVEIIAVKPAFDEDKKPGIPIIDKATSSDLTANKPAKQEVSVEVKDAGISLDEQTATLSSIRADITGEYNTITLYKQHILSFENLYKQTKDEKYAQLVKIYNDIVEEEQLHVGQLNKAIEIMDPEETAIVNKGIKEAKKNIQDEDVEKPETPQEPEQPQESKEIKTTEVSDKNTIYAPIVDEDTTPINDMSTYERLICVPAHIEFRNKIKVPDLQQRLSNSDKNNNNELLEKSLSGDLSELINDYMVDRADSRIVTPEQREQVNTHYRKYVDVAKKYYNCYINNPRIKQELDEFIRRLPN